MFCTAKLAKNKLFLRSDFRPLPNKNVQIWDHFFPLLFPKDSESLKILDIRLREVGAKRRLNGTSKVNRRTHTRKYIWIFRLIESIGPKGRCFENHYSQTVRARDLNFYFWDNVNHPMCVLCVLCLVSGVKCHMSCVMCQVSLKKIRWRRKKKKKKYIKDKDRKKRV